MEEQFKAVKDYDGYYEVSNLGNIRSLPRNVNLSGRIMKQQRDSDGYLCLNLSMKGVTTKKWVHILIAESFLNYRSRSSKIVSFKNHDKSIVTLENIKITTPRESHNKENKSYTSKYIGVSWHESVNKWRAQIHIEGKQIHLGYFEKETEARGAYLDRLKEYEKQNSKKLTKLALWKRKQQY
jgi:hypothetical protein